MDLLNELEEEKKEEIKVKEDICDRCFAKNSFRLDMRNGLLLCISCGNVIEDRIIDDTYEKRNFGSESGGNRNDSRIGGPMKAGEGNNLGSNLVKINKDGTATRAKTGGGAYSQSPLERNYEEIGKILGNKEVSRAIIEETRGIYSQVIKELKMKGRNFKAIICAMYFIASRRLKQSKSFKEISTMFSIPENKIKKAYNHIKKVVVSVLTEEEQNATLENYIRNFCEVNSENFEYKDLATKIAQNINKSCLLEGKNTKTITGLALYIAMKLEKTINVNKTKICAEFGSSSTIDSAYNEISNSFDIIIPEKYKDQIEKLTLNK